MKARKLFTVLLLLFSITFFGQESKKEKIRTLKIAYITKDLNLSSAEAQKFWPIYNSIDEKQYDIRMVKMRKLKNELKEKPIENFSEAEATRILNQLDELDKSYYENKRKLHSDLLKIISPVKILKLKQAEDNFNKSLLKQYRKGN